MLFGKDSKGATPTTITSVVNSIYHLTLDVYMMMRSRDNMLLSPYPLSTALAMLLEGANGTTEEELRQAIHLLVEAGPSYGSLSNSFKLDQANGLWIGAKPQKAFLKKIARHYSGLSEYVSLSNAERSSKHMNHVIAKLTKGKITGLISPGSLEQAKLVLTSSLYFTSEWLYHFEEVHERTFYIDRSTDATCRLMNLTAELNYGETEDAKILELPFKKGFSMIILLPWDLDIEHVENKIFADQLMSLELEKQRIQLFMPKFMIQKTYDLQRPLSQLGVKEAFAETADFSKIAPGLRLSRALQKSRIDISENGTIAPPAPPALSPRQEPEKPVEFNANHPFLFFIRDNIHNVPIFFGKVYDPTKQ